jgi:citrate lyase beta subunit
MISAAKRGFFKTITSGLYVPGNQERMLLKCVTAKASLIVPDLEDSVPH